jgi:hypothetical protein
VLEEVRTLARVRDVKAYVARSARVLEAIEALMSPDPRGRRAPREARPVDRFHPIAFTRSLSPDRFHPMAFTFPRRDPSKLFLPTIHVHDGRVLPAASFDHALYVQGAGETDARWTTSNGTPTRYASAPPAISALVAANRCVRRRKMFGLFDNEDVWLDVDV